MLVLCGRTKLIYFGQKMRTAKEPAAKHHTYCSGHFCATRASSLCLLQSSNKQTKTTFFTSYRMNYSYVSFQVKSTDGLAFVKLEAHTV